MAEDFQGKFDVDHIYLQWINFRLKKFDRINSVILKTLWYGNLAAGLIAACVVLIEVSGPDTFPTLYNILPTWLLTTILVIVAVISFYPVVISLGVMPAVDLFIMFPTIIRSDIHRGFYSMLAPVPVRSNSIAADARMWIYKNTFWHVLPGITWLVGMVLFQFVIAIINYGRFHAGFYTWYGILRIIIEDVLPVTIVTISGWYLLLNIIVLSTLRSRLVNTGCLIFLLIILHWIVTLATVYWLSFGAWSRHGFQYNFIWRYGIDTWDTIDFNFLVTGLLISLTFIVPALFYIWLQKYFVDWLRHDRVI